MIIKRNAMRRGLGLLLATLCFGLALCGTANAGSYIVAQCSPGIYPGAPDASFSASTSHYFPRVDCSSSAAGLQVLHRLASGETGTTQGAYGGWVWQAPAGTYITGGSTFSRLATEDGQHGYLAVSPDVGAGLSYENQNDDQGHEAGIPPGNWRYLVARLQCTQPNEGLRRVRLLPWVNLLVQVLKPQSASLKARSGMLNCKSTSQFFEKLVCFCLF